MSKFVENTEESVFLYAIKLGQLAPTEIGSNRHDYNFLSYKISCPDEGTHLLKTSPPLCGRGLPGFLVTRLVDDGHATLPSLYSN